MLKPILVLMTRWPAPYRCKTRLAKDLGVFRAAAIQRRMTIHTIEVAKAINASGEMNVKLAIDGIGKKKAKEWCKYIGIKTAYVQGPGNLELKMKRQLVLSQRTKTCRARIPRDTILIGADVANISLTDIMAGLKSLKSNELVIGPSKDGGFWLIGFSKRILHPEIFWPFNEIRWGKETVLNDTLKKVRLKRIQYELIHEKNDIDNVSDLITWQQ